MHRQSQIELYSRKWSNLSLMYRLEQMKVNPFGLNYTKYTFPLRKRSDYFYIEKPPISRYLLLPETNFRLIWEILSITIILYQVISVPYILSYSTSSPNLHFLFLELSDIFFIVEIFMNFNTAFYSEGVLVSAHKHIFKKYIKDIFVIDLLSCLPLEMFLKDMQFDDASVSSSFKFFWMLKLLNIFKLGRYYDNLQSRFSNEFIYTIFHILKFLCTALLMIHWTACSMYAVFLYDFENIGMKWYYIYDKGTSPYLKYFYMIVFTMTSTGYGDITPYSLNQKLLTIVFMSFSCWLFAFILTGSQVILLKYNSADDYYRSIILKAKVYMNYKKVNRQLRIRVISYLNFLKENVKKKNLNELEVLNLVSPTLKEEICIETRGKLIQRCQLFGEYSMDFRREILRCLDITVYALNDIVIKEGDRSNSLYFIVKGKVEIYHESTQTVFIELRDKKYFGEIAFYLKRTRCASARCLEFTEVLYLTRHKMKETLNRRPKEKENHLLLTKLAEKNLMLIGVKCYLCGEYGHTARDCKKFVIIVNKEEIAKRSNDKKYDIHKSIFNAKSYDLKRDLIFSHYSKTNATSSKVKKSRFPDQKTLNKLCRNYNDEEKSRKKYKIKELLYENDSNNESEISRQSSFLPERFQYSLLYYSKKNNSSNEYSSNSFNESRSDSLQMTFGN